MRCILFCLMLAWSGSLVAAADDYYPLADGQETIMTFSLERDGKVVHDIFHALVEGTIEKEGKTYYRLRSWLETNRLKQDITKLVRKNSEGVYSITDVFTGSSENTEFVLPLKTGATWKQTIAGKTIKTSTVEINVIDREAVTIGDANYANCYHISEISDGGYKSDLWMAPDIGIIKSKTVLRNGDILTYTIQEFKPGKRSG